MGRKKEEAREGGKESGRQKYINRDRRRMDGKKERNRGGKEEEGSAAVA